MRLWVIEGDNNQRYEDSRNWFVGLATSLEGVETLVKGDLRFALDLSSHENVEDCKPETEHPVQPKPDSNFAWDWKREGWGKLATLVIYSYELEGVDFVSDSDSKENDKGMALEKMPEERHNRSSEVDSDRG